MNWMEHLPILQVILPLMAAPVAVLLHRSAATWTLAMIVSIISLGISIELLYEVLEKGEIRYFIGGWAPPWGIEIRLDAVNGFVLLIVSAISTVVLPYARESINQEIPKAQHYLFYTAWLLCLTGLLGITATGDAFNVFVFLEISSLSTYLLISLGKDRRALLAAFQYLVLGTIGATFILIGIGLMYMVTGTLNMVDLSERLADISDNRTVLVAFAFLAIGLGLKAAVFPLHIWLANAYAYAPSAVSAFLAGTSTKVAIYVALRFFFTIFGADFSFGTMALYDILLPLAIIGIFVSSLVAVYQDNLKRMLAYSSVAQIGYMILGVSMASVTGLTATMLHLFNHALMKTALFMALGCITYRTGAATLNHVIGLGRRMPLTMAAFGAGGVSLIGVPLTVGFNSKWYLILATLERDWWWLAGLILLSSLISVIYVWKVVEMAYFRQPSQTNEVCGEAPWSLLIPTWILIAANFWFGIDSSMSLAVADQAAHTLMRISP